MEIIQVQYYQSPYGELKLASFDGKLCMCDWMGGKPEHRASIDRRLERLLEARFEIATSEVITKTVVELDEYFAHKRRTFDIPLLFIGSDFQKLVWNELQNIPYGATLSYKELSIKIGNPKAMRAVAGANGANAISIVVPCHRVIGSNNKLTGYGGGLAAKKGLLDLEIIT